jgi:hypothetical protein
VYKDGTADRTVPDRHGGTFPHVPLRGSLLPGQQSAADEHTRKPTPHGQGPVKHNTLEGLSPPSPSLSLPALYSVPSTIRADSCVPRGAAKRAEGADRHDMADILQSYGLREITFWHVLQFQRCPPTL